METRLSNIFNYKHHDSGKGHSRKPLYSSTSHIQIENTKTIRLLFKGSWILLYFWHSNWHYFGYISGKFAKPHFSESPQKSLKTRQHQTNRATHYEITVLYNYEKFVFFWRLLQKLKISIFDSLLVANQTFTQTEYVIGKSDFGHIKHFH